MQGSWDFHRLSTIADLNTVLSNPKSPWVLDGLSENPNLTIDFIRTFNRIRGVSLLPTVPIRVGEDRWDWDKISTVIDPIEILLHPTLPWSRQGLSRNPKLSVALIERLDQCSECFTDPDNQWDWPEISYRAKMSDVLAHPNIPWYLPGSLGNLWTGPARTGLSNNPRLTVAVIDRLGRNRDGWDWAAISRTININEVLENPELPWDSDALLDNPGINPRIIFELEEYINFGYELENEEVRTLSRDPNRVRDWDRWYLSNNPDLTLEYMRWFDSIVDRPGDWAFSHLTRVLTIGEIVEGRREYDWDPNILASRPDLIEALRVDPEWVLAFTRMVSIPSSSQVRLSDVYRRPDLPWSREALSSLPDLTPQDMRRLDLMVGVRQQQSPIGRLQPGFGSMFRDFGTRNLW